MTIIVFLIDTSASMNQRTFIGPSFLDLAKGAVDTFLKFRSRDPSRGGDRYMLLTFEEMPKNIKAGWRENQMVFMQELKNLKATGITTVGNAIGNALHLLNVNRLQSGIDNFGAGRYPHWLEPAVIIVITDGGCMVHPNGTIKQNVEITPSQLPGSELVTEPFRWDQRVFALVLRLAGHPAKGGASAGLSMVPQDTNPIDAICEATGGRSYSVTTQKMINQCLESLVQKIQSGVVVTFEKYGSDPSTVTAGTEDRTKNIPLENGFIHQNSKLGSNHVAPSTNNNSNPIVETGTSSRPSSPSPPPQEPAWTKTRKMIYVARGSGSRGYNISHWTIPEAFWPDHNMNVLPPRSAHPIIRFKCEPQEPVFPTDLPYDKYELEPSPLTQFILERKQPQVCWFCYVFNSNGKQGDLGAPFAYLKASTAMNSVTLTVLPYNFPVLLPLIDEVRLVKGKPTQQWRTKFEKYLKGLPPYYIGPLKTAFQKVNLAHLLTDVPDKHLGVNVLSHLGKVKVRARDEMDKLNQAVGQLTPMHDGVRVIPRSTTVSSSTSTNKSIDAMQQAKLDANEYVGFRVHVTTNANASSLPKSAVLVNGQQHQSLSQTMSFRNPFDIQREQLLMQIAKMRVNLKQSFFNGATPHLVGAKPGLKYRLQDVEELHQLPIGSMGNYQDYLRLMTPPLREIDATPARLHAFGNPFKVDKKMFVDEADIDVLVGSSATGTSANAGQNTGGRAHGKKTAAAAAASSESANANRSGQANLQSPINPRKRKAGPLPKNFRYWKKRKRDTDDDQYSNSSGPSSPALSDILSISDSETISDTESIISERSTTPDSVSMEETEGPTNSTLIIDESEMDQLLLQNSADLNERCSGSVASDDQMPSSSSSASTANLDSSPSSNLGLSSLIRRSMSAGENGSDLSKKKKRPAAKIKMTTDEWADLKKEISALIRKPSQDYRSLFEKIDNLPKSVNHGLYSWTLNEAERFRRTDLCDRLRERFNLESRQQNQPRR